MTAHPHPSEKTQSEAPWAQPDYQARLEELTESYMQSSLDNAARIQRKLARPRVGWSTDPAPSAWPTVGKKIAGNGLESLHVVLDANEDSWAYGGKPIRQDPFDQAIKQVASDWNGTLDPKVLQRGVDSAFANFGGELFDLTGAVNGDPAWTHKAEQTIALLVSFGEYKLGAWSAPQQLDTAAALMERFTERVPEFDPWKAGLASLLTSTTLSMGGGGPHMTSALRAISRAEAHLAMRRERTVRRPAAETTDVKTKSPAPQTAATLGESAVSETITPPARRRPAKHVARRIGQHGTK